MNANLKMRQLPGSSAVQEVGHDPVSSTMYVRFKEGGGLYTYPNTSAADFSALLAAPSAGKHLRKFHAGKGQPVGA